MELVEIYKLPDGCYELYFRDIEESIPYESDVKIYISH